MEVVLLEVVLLRALLAELCRVRRALRLPRRQILPQIRWLRAQRVALVAEVVLWQLDRGPRSGIAAEDAAVQVDWRRLRLGRGHNLTRNDAGVCRWCG